MQPSPYGDVFSLNDLDDKPPCSVTVTNAPVSIREYAKKFFKFPLPPDPPDVFDILERGLLMSG